MKSETRINLMNVGLMIFSSIAAFIMPFEVFLFAYAVMGPLHYLTEISWLHDRQYFTKGKFDSIVLWLIGIIILLESLAHKNHWSWPFSSDFSNKIIFVALTGSLLMIFLKNGYVKVFGLIAVLLISNTILNLTKDTALLF